MPNTFNIRELLRLSDNLPFIMFAIIFCAVPALAFYSIYKYKAARRTSGLRTISRARVALIITWALFSFQILCIAWGFFVEPKLLSVTHLEFHNPKITNPATRIRICQISDLHLEGHTPLLDKIIAEVNREKPDFILLTGDYMNTPRASGALLDFLKRLKARAAVYAVYGNWDNYDYDPSLQFGLAGIKLLDKRIVSHEIGGTRFVFSGFSSNEQGKYLFSPDAKKSVNVILYHYPDEIYNAERANADYYFCGHTHGGQVRIPFYGAFFTLSRYGKRFEMGEYDIGRATMYVTRGVGLEGNTPLRLRFNCRPEIVFADIMK